jgi:hypothetical protein
LEEKICNDMDISMKKLEELINVQWKQIKET